MNTATRARTRGRRPPWGFLVVIGVPAAILGMTWATLFQTPDLIGGAFVAVGLAIVSVPLLRRVARREDDPVIVKMIIGGLVLKMLAALVRLTVVLTVYGGVADANIYDRAGRDLAGTLRTGGVFNIDIGTRVVGTGFIKLVTGAVYAVTGASKLGGFIVFSWLGFWGLYFFYQAFRIAIPHGDVRRYATLIFFLPSLLFWSSSIGKEAWMTFTLGLVAYGTARVLTHGRRGVVLLALGLIGSGMVRPHVTLLALVGLGAAYVIRRPRRRTAMSPVFKAAGVLVLVAAAGIAVSQVERFLRIDQLDTQSAQDVLMQIGEQTSQGGSQFSAPRAPSLINYPTAVVTVLYRPLITEARSLQSLAAATEGTLFLVLTLLSARRLRGVPSQARSTPYLVFAAVYCALFLFAFSSISNFGIIARERVQVYPFALVLLCAPVSQRERSRRRVVLQRTIVRTVQVPNVVSPLTSRSAD